MKKLEGFENPHAALKHVLVTELFSPACFFTESEEEIWEEDDGEGADIQALVFLILTLPDPQILSDHEIAVMVEACMNSIYLILAIAGNNQESIPYNSFFNKEERTLHFYTTDVLPDGCYDILATNLVALSKRYGTFIQEMKPRVVNEDDSYSYFSSASSAVA
jgi:hypothetical protein